jgi:hypothetical protein
MSAFEGKADMVISVRHVCFRPKADIGKRRFDHFQLASLTRYDALIGALGAGNAAT